MKRRILLVHPFAQDISGPDRSILAVMEHLVPAGYAYDVVLPGPSPFGPAYERLGCRLFTYPMSIIKRRLDPAFLAGYAWRFLPTVRFLMRVIRETHPDLVHTNGAVILGSGLAARLTGTPSVYHIRCSQIAHPRLVASLIVGLIARTSRHVIGISRACAAPMTERGYGAMTTVIHNGIDLAPFERAADPGLWRTSCGWGPEHPVVGQVGRMAPIKGFLEFVRLAALVSRQMPAARFVAVGGPFLESERAYEAEVRAEAKRLGVANRIHFAGRRDDIPAAMAGFDLFVTLAREEGFGRVAVEAMAAGRAVVANAVDGLVEVVAEGETGFLTGPDDPEAAAARVIELLRDPARRETFGSAGRQRARALFSAEECARRTAGIYERVLADSGADG